MFSALGEPNCVIPKLLCDNWLLAVSRNIYDASDSFNTNQDYPMKTDYLPDYFDRIRALNRLETVLYSI